MSIWIRQETILLSPQFTQNTAPQKEMSHTCFGITAYNKTMDTPVSFRFRSHKVKEKIIKKTCWNSPLSCRSVKSTV